MWSRFASHAFKLKRLDALERHYHEMMMAQTSLDTLTGVNNRSAVLSFLEKHADLSRRHHRPLSLVIADLDNFKSVNDRFGHATGDRALQVLRRPGDEARAGAATWWGGSAERSS